ncbi:MAG TPA: 16S rRNA (guanine(966)-N(2))-methyltransferase RsmD [Candidatus Kapabacteria bacterium]|mgnify:CR=1 FL=1|nr:16S rRNA (guanine(966)-N(2))-methyltransferase RsmD [Candidatus Kapabacteria bacterium]HPO63305.1 16S rRNA (guanine(966)-N(2))-methyltransferase RsmD [Candidatus Kapabacteria bacterium]
MRIISGEKKGRKLIGKISQSTRPATDSNRETVFNILNNYIDIEDSIVLDLFAGSGAMGFEALSRGAKHSFFIDSNKTAIECIEKNASNLDFEKDDFSIFKIDALKAIKLLSKKDLKFDLIFIDPPYRSNLVNSVLFDLIKNDLISFNAILSIEISSKEGIVTPEQYEFITERVLGITKIIFLKRI